MRPLGEYEGGNKDIWGTPTFKRKSKEREKLGGNITEAGGNQEKVTHCRTQGRRRVSAAERLSMRRIKMRDTVRLLRLVEMGSK